MRVVGLVAAAGRSSRMGRPKALLTMEGVPFAVRLHDAFRGAGADPVLVTLPEPPDTEAVRAALAPQLKDATLVRNARPDDGLAGSVWTALDQCPQADALLLSPVDSPFATRALARALVDALAAGAPAAVVTHKGAPGHPVAFGASCFEALGHCGARGGPRAVLEAFAGALVEVPCDDERVRWNVNTPADYARLTGVMADTARRE